MSFGMFRTYMSVSIVLFLCATGLSMAQMDEDIVRAIEYNRPSKKFKDGIKSGEITAIDVAAVVNALGKEERLKVPALTTFLKLLSDICTKEQFTSIGGAVVNESKKVLLASGQAKVQEAYAKLAKDKGASNRQVKASIKTPIPAVNQHNLKLWNKRLRGAAKVVETINDGDGGPLSKK